GTDRLRLEVEDRGVGMPNREPGGLGLIAMRERADILQGTLDILRPEQGGTLIVLDIPLTQAVLGGERSGKRARSGRLVVTRLCAKASAASSKMIPRFR